MITPRGMSKKDAAAYAGCDTLSSFNDWVRRGIMPGPIPGTQKWDRKAIDAALDRLSGLEPTIAPSAYDQWKAGQDARQPQGNPRHLQKVGKR
jgi:hypothetical protein